MKNILIVAPTERENRNIRLAIECRGEQLKNKYTVAFSGIGKAAAAATITRYLLQAEQPYDLVAVIGYAAGTLGFKQGEVVMPNRVQYHDADIPEGFIPEVSDPRNLLGTDDITVFTGDSFVNAKSVAEIKARFGVERAIFDMEIGAIAIACEMCNNMPLVAVKVISDVPEDGHTELSYDEFANTWVDFSPILNRIEDL
ncbi:MAG: 5'-methylthioadenosine/S-adenosylhomocysteine nucleosidase [Rikenellaceae bacterium]|nr:5'-methylthioadenosine/S-adenosylhomocysteine nucleosidase [Rikenellaceae bacterium]